MKKLMIAVMAGLALLTGCDETGDYRTDTPEMGQMNSEWTDLGYYVEMRTVTVEGHKYLVTALIGSSVSTVHAESCMCKRAK